MARERVPACPLREENDSGGIGGSHLCELFGNLSDGIVPGDRRKLCLAALAGAFHGAAQAIGVVQRLYRCLTARAEVAAGDRVERIAFNLLDRGDALAKLFAVALDGSNALHDAHHGAASRTAPGANRGMPLLLTGYDFMLGDQEGNGLVGLAAAAAQRGR